MVLALLGLMGCAGAPGEAMAWRESWELFGLTDDGAVIDVRMTVGNTGVLRGQGHVRLHRWRAEEPPIFYARDAHPGAHLPAADGRGLRVGPDSLRWEQERWRLRTASEDANAALQLTPGGPDVATAAWQSGGGQWSIAAPVTGGTLEGVVVAGQRGGAASGRGVLLHRGGDGVPNGDRDMALVLGPGVTIGFDRQGDHSLTWARIDGTDLDTQDAQLRTIDGAVELDFRPAADLQVRLRPRAGGGESDAREHLTLPERWLANAWLGPAIRTVHPARATITRGTERRTAAGLVLHVGAPQPPLETRASRAADRRSARPTP